jgi:hypothetical protein
MDTAVRSPVLECHFIDQVNNSSVYSGVIKVKAEGFILLESTYELAKMRSLARPLPFACSPIVGIFVRRVRVGFSRQIRSFRVPFLLGRMPR